MAIEAPQVEFVYRHAGYCPVCECNRVFTATNAWYRDFLCCAGCGSIPRERALALTLGRRFPQWRAMVIHESSPVWRGISLKLRRECRGYLATHFFPHEQAGTLVRGYRNENLEAQTFAEGTFDLVVTLDVMEHVNDPAQCLREIARTLKAGGCCLFTVPTYKAMTTTERCARYLPDGAVEHYAAPEYHGNPISRAGALVTFRYGYDLPELIYEWSGMDVEVQRFHDHHHGVIGEFTEVYLARKR